MEMTTADNKRRRQADNRQTTDGGRQTTTDNRRTADGRQMEDELRERTPNGTERSARLSRLRRWENENGESDRRSRSNSGSCLLLLLWLLLRYWLCLGSARGVCVLCAALRCVYARWTLTCGSKWTLRMLRAMRATRATHVQTRNVRKAKRKCPTSWRNSFSRAATR